MTRKRAADEVGSASSASSAAAAEERWLRARRDRDTAIPVLPVGAGGALALAP
jgi:hypothetical protein